MVKVLWPQYPLWFSKEGSRERSPEHRSVQGTCRRSCSTGLLQLFFPFLKDRFLTDDQDVWTHNAWDRVPPPDDQDEMVATAMAKQRSLPVPEEEKAKINAKPSRNWYISQPGACKPHVLNTRRLGITSTRTTLTTSSGIVTGAHNRPSVLAQPVDVAR